MAATSCTRTMCAPSQIDAATAAAVPHTRPSGGRSPIADFRNDLRDGPDTIGQPEVSQRGQARQHGHRVLGLLRETKARVNQQLAPSHTGGDRHVDPILELGANLGHHVGILRLLVHRGRPPSIVHENGRDAGVCHHTRQRGVVQKRADVVDDGGACIDGAPRNLGFVGVDGDGDCGAAAQPFEHGPDAAPFLFDVQRFGSRTCGLSADVEQVGALVNQAQRIGDGDRGVTPQAAVRKRVGCDVDDGHDERALAEPEDVPAWQRQVEVTPGQSAWESAARSADGQKTVPSVLHHQRARAASAWLHPDRSPWPGESPGRRRALRGPAVRPRS